MDGFWLTQQASKALEANPAWRILDKKAREAVLEAIFDAIPDYDFTVDVTPRPLAQWRMGVRHAMKKTGVLDVFGIPYQKNVYRTIIDAIAATDGVVTPEDVVAADDVPLTTFGAGDEDAMLTLIANAKYVAPVEDEKP